MPGGDGRVARTINRHLPSNPNLTAAAFLHDSPEYAPRSLDLDATLTNRLGPEVPRIIRTLQAEHHALAHGNHPNAPTADPPALQLSTADKIISLTTAIHNATVAPDPAAYWASRPAFVHQLGYLAAFSRQATGHLPVAMTHTLSSLTARATTRARSSS